MFVTWLDAAVKMKIKSALTVVMARRKAMVSWDQKWSRMIGF